MSLRADDLELVIQPPQTHHVRCIRRRVYAEDPITMIVNGAAAVTGVDMDLLPVQSF